MYISSRLAQWKRAGPITQRSVDRNHDLLNFYFSSAIFLHLINHLHGINHGQNQLSSKVWLLHLSIQELSSFP